MDGVRSLTYLPEGVTALTHRAAVPRPSPAGRVVDSLAQGLRFVTTMLAVGDRESMFISLGLLETMLSGIVRIGGDDAKALDGMVPVLGPLTKSDDPEIAAMASAIRIAIATRNPRWAGGGGASAPEEAGPKRMALDAVLVELQDPIVPVRAHAVMELRKLVLARDEATLANVPMLLGLFAEQLAGGPGSRPLPCPEPPPT